MSYWWWWCPPLDEPIQASASNFFQTVITPMPIEYFLHVKPLSNRELKGLSEYVKKLAKNKPKCQ